MCVDAVAVLAVFAAGIGPMETGATMGAWVGGLFQESQAAAVDCKLLLQKALVV